MQGDAEEEDNNQRVSLTSSRGLLLGELQEKKYKLSRLEEGTKVRGKDGKLHIERFVDGVLVKEEVTQDVAVVPTFLSDAARGRSELFPKRYNRETHRWVIAQQEDTEVVKFESNVEGETTPQTRLRFVTFNVWFDDYFKEERALGLLDMIQKLDPHFICFQECTQTFLEIVKNQPWIYNHYALSDSVGSTIHPYGVLMLSKLPVRKFYKYKFKTSMGRRLLLAEVLYNVNGGQTKKLSVSTAHLESLKEAQSRIRQLEVVFNTLNALKSPSPPSTTTTTSTNNSSNHHATTTTPTDQQQQQSPAAASPLSTPAPSREFDSAFHMGDFNFGDNRTAFPENDHLSPEFKDCWKELHLETPGNTYKNDRYDKIIYRSSDFKLEAIEVIGNTPLFQDANNDNEPVYPSDHFGLFASFKLSE
eukprot:TRINITY_DN2658_c2_g1_i1.p1 TRINITY_DN2658_c2_g1~~TRINITY_DN2658_c2_g1_i1.p1  ORF type:complete len:418 (+),score=128.59 TRINITY_DN2658_c2_g1_i1:116-1369(+)